MEEYRIMFRFNCGTPESVVNYLQDGLIGDDKKALIEEAAEICMEHSITAEVRNEAGWSVGVIGCDGNYHYR